MRQITENENYQYRIRLMPWVLFEILPIYRRHLYTSGTPATLLY